eukprot:TRINITY_DN4897_c0_g1_i1.p1 TRINITY_DN4897_c0_g1~~TRINITY_DN4897_c0_g1_i1.p1  ORF type:complete len:297 (+),score=45.20 TRINITY_DN4897_c0_g1_i1:28-918(+)
MSGRKKSTMLLVLLLLLLPVLVPALRVLQVQAHPDDETAFSSVLFKATHDLNATVDILVVTFGEGGYAHSFVADYVYHLDLGNEAVGRKHLPAIRKNEMECACSVLMCNHLYWLGQPDVKFTTNLTIVLKEWWNASLVQEQMKEILLQGNYDLVTNMLPSPDNHGEHQAASVLVLQAIQELPVANRPAVIGGTNPLTNYQAVPDYPATAAPPSWSWSFDRTQLLIPNDTISYEAIGGWDFGCHKSQGGLQIELAKGIVQKVEYYWNYDINSDEATTFISSFFDLLATIPFNVNRLH